MVARRGVALAFFGAVVSIQSQSLFIDVGAHQVQPSLAGQSFTLNVENRTGSDVVVGGLDFKIQVGDGGPEAPGGGTDGPEIMGIDIITGTVFDGVSSQIDPGSIPQFANRTTTVPSSPGPGTVTLAAHSTTPVATVFINTAGFSSPQTWDLNIFSTIDTLPTRYLTAQGATITIGGTDGSISVLVPEPSTYSVLAGFACLGWAAWSRRSRSQKR
jgi:hypothetical protein